MIRTISLDDYYNLDTDWVSSTTEQWEENGLEISFDLECDSEYYYLTLYSTEANDWFYEQHPDYDRTPLNYTIKHCKEFACKVCDTLEEVNYIIRQHLPKYCEFVVAENGTIYGN